MKKMNLFRNSLFVILGACIMWSCVGKQSYLTAVPSDTQAAIKINPGVIFDKTNLKNNTQFQGLMMAANGLIGMAVRDQDVAKTAMEAVKNPSDALGIDFNKPIVVTASGLDDATSISDNAQVYAILSVRNSDAVIKAFETISDLQQEENIYTGSYSVKDLTFKFGFNDRSFVICLYTDKTDDRIVELLSQDKITVTDNHFDAFVDNTDDIVSWFNGNTYIDLAASVIQSTGQDRDSFEDALAGLKNGAFVTSTNADYGTLSWTIKAYSDIEQEDASLPTADVLKRLPENSTIALAFKFDKDIMKENVKKSAVNQKDSVQNEQLAKIGLTNEMLYDIMAGGVGAAFIIDENPKFIVTAAGLDEDSWNTFVQNTPMAQAKAEYSFDGTFGTIRTPGLTFGKDLTGTRIADIIGKGGAAIDFKKFDASAFDDSKKGEKIAKEAIGLLDYAQWVATEDGKGVEFDILFNTMTKNALEIIADFVLGNIK